MAKVLVLGSGSREHAIASKLLESDDVGHVFVSPGNQGMVGAGGSSSSITVVGDLDVHNHQQVSDWCRCNDVSLAIIGPENLLAEGLSDSLNKSGILCFGPSAGAARIESSKEFSKQFMTQFNIPTARWESFTDSKQACDYIRHADFPALVVKASGLAAGKGVIVAKDKEEACQAAVDILQGRFGEAGSTIVVEEMLEGEEVSCLAFCDGTTVVPMPPAQDHKRLLDGDRGPNTGGMGAYCPCPLITDMEMIKTNVLQKTVDCLRQLNFSFTGVLYAGLMLTKDGPKVLEFNCRFGDPETQVILPLLKSSLYSILSSCVLGRLDTIKVEYHRDRFAVGVVMASGGYPEGFQKGYAISGIKDAVKQSASVFCAGVSRGESGQLVTSGGRVLTVVATDSSLSAAASKAQAAASLIMFTGRTYRSDIAHKALRFLPSGLTYRDAGVDIEAGESLVHRIRPLAKSTSRPGCTPDLGLFGGIFDMKPLGYVDPLLVTGTDGVGTKLQIAHAVGNFDSVGIDLVAMSVNDILCHAAEPLFFLDCFSCSKLDVGIAGATIAGITEGCLQANCALVGGETAEMPGTYQSGHFEVSGFVVGAVERAQYLPRSSEIVPGDVVIGIPSTGVHSNGFSLVRAVVSQCQLTYDLPCPFETGKSLGESLLTPTKIYVRGTLGTLRSGLVKATAHITGGGLPGNIPRVLPDHVGVQLDAMAWNMLPVFGWIFSAGKVDVTEMSRTFNCGIGFIIITSSEHQSTVLQNLRNDGEVHARVIGSVVSMDNPAQKHVNISNLEEALIKSYQPVSTSTSLISNGGCRSDRRKQRVAVLISGSGTNLQALIDHTTSQDIETSSEIVLVISNVANVAGLKRAEKAGIRTKVISHKAYGSREQFDSAVHEELINSQIDIVCLAGFMRIVSGWFVQKWRGKLVNIHPSLLPSFKGAHAHRLVLEAGVRITGCTVHFVAEDVDAGAIIAQEAVPVDVNDNEETLSERVKLAEHKIYPQAVELLACGKVKLSEDGKSVWS